MITFGICIGSEDKFEKYALPGLRRCAEPDSAIAESTGNASIFKAYNEMLEAFAGKPDLEALVLLHDDLELRDEEFCAKVRARLADPEVAIVGAIGARSVTSLRWWEGEGFGRAAETRCVVDFGGGSHDVDMVDGLLLVLSPWAVENLRFDERRFAGFHGYDLDICFQARAAGKRVVVEEFDLFHHTKTGYGDEASFARADATFREKWFGDRGTGRSRDCAICGTAVPEPRHCIEDRKIVPCSGCGAGMTFPEPSRDIVSDGLFAEMYGGQRIALRPQWFFEAEHRLSWLMLYVPDGSLMEVGCATGEFAAVAARAGYETYAVEPSTWAAEQAAELGVQVTVGDVSLWCEEHPGQQVDIAVAFHVLEHLHDPVGFLREIRQALRPGGLVAIEVPNYACQAAGLDPVGWAGPAIADHVYHYTPDSLRVVLEAAGFELEHHIEFSTRCYDNPDIWSQKRRMWRQSGIVEPNLDMLRGIARAL